MARYAEWFGVAVVAGLIVALAARATEAETVTAEAIYEEAGVQGGLVVQVGCGDGTLTATLRVGPQYVVQALDADDQCVAQTRERIASKGPYGPVSVRSFDGEHLPYVDELVNLVIVTCDACRVGRDELARVLAPDGVAMIHGIPPEGSSRSVREAPCGLAGWTRLLKPRPAEIDQWTHFLHDGGGNAVAQDRRVASPRGLRWLAGPRWCRTHEFPSSVNAVVTAGGRLYTLFDEGITGIYQKVPQDCKLVARDAASGVLLWKVPLQQWQPEFGTGTGNRWNIHHTIPRRLIAEGDRVYVTLRFLDSPVSVLDGATGQILIEALEGTQGTDEMVLSDGVLIAKLTHGRSVGATERFGKERLDDTLVAVDVQTGKQLWRKQNTRVVPYALSAQAGRVVYHNMDELVCLDAETGAERWRVPNEIRSTVGGGSTLVIRDGVVLFHGQGRSGPPAEEPAGGRKGKKQAAGTYLTALALDDGKLLWMRRGGRPLSGACTQPTDVFVVGQTVWCGNALTGYDLRTGEVKQTLSLDQLISPGHHYRCHRAKATERFMIWPKRGAEFVDLEGENHMRNDWLRAPCFTGLTPANGLLYVPPSQCFCYPGVKVSGFLAMSAEETPDDAPASERQRRLQRGPAYKTSGAERSSPDSHPSDDWPTYRHDALRSGGTTAAVPAELEERWQVDLACQATQPVIVGDRLWVAEKDAHRIRCLDAATGRDVWRFTADARIDSSPTIDAGRVLFGCRDGSVYALRADDGALAWRFHAAPGDRQVVAFEQLESVWPVHGSVLVQDGTAYFAAGRSSFLDGGIFVYALNAETGDVLAEHRLQGPWPDIHKDVGRPFAMEGALPDVIVSDGKDLYMRRIKFDARLNRLPTTRESDLGELDMGANHLAATGGLLDDTGFDRLYWMYSQRWPGFYFSQQSPKAGQLLVFDRTTTYAVKYFYRRFMWSPLFIPAEHGYLLFADDNDNQPILEERGQPARAIQWLPAETLTDKHKRGGRGSEKGTGYVRAEPAKWQTMVPLRIRALLLADDRLFAVGTPDTIDPKDPMAAFEGRKGVQLQAFSARDGSLLNSIALASLPAFDGLSAAGGRLYLATRDGKLISFGGKR